LRKASSLKVAGDFTFGHAVKVGGDGALESGAAKRIPADTVLDG
jgi:UTP--glucose-1-phosphate uridylyltransferase